MAAKANGMGNLVKRLNGLRTKYLKEQKRQEEAVDEYDLHLDALDHFITEFDATDEDVAQAKKAVEMFEQIADTDCK
jgi:hypothetical protein